MTRDFLEFLSALDVPEEDGLVFVAMPFEQEMTTLYRSHIEPALAASGYTPVRADDVYEGRPVMEAIVDLLQRCEVVVALVSGRNANVLYELGMACAWGKRIVVASHRVEDVPFDMRHFPIVILDRYRGTSVGRAISLAVDQVRTARQHAMDASSVPMRILAGCEALGIVDTRETNVNRLFRIMAKAETSVLAVGLSGRSIFAADNADLRRLHEHMKRIDVSVVLSKPGTPSSTYSDALEGTGPEASSLQVRLSTARFRSLGFPVFWTSHVIHIGGVVVDRREGLLQFFHPGRWHTTFMHVRSVDGGMFHAIDHLLHSYLEGAEPAPQELA